MSDTEQIMDLRQCLVYKSEILCRKNKKIADGLDEIGELLARYDDPAPSTILGAADQKSQDFATYFLAAYSETHNLNKSIAIYRAVKTLVRYIVLMDRYYEIGDKTYETIARDLIQNIKNSFRDRFEYSIDFALKQFWPFWEFEQITKKRMINDCTFTFNELRYFNLFKSSDAPIIYSTILESELCNFNPNVALILHYNQALQDIYDDYEDIEEDICDIMPNVFILAALGHIPFSRIINAPSGEARKLIVDNESVDSMIITLVKHYNDLVHNISVSPNFSFLRCLTKDYANRIILALNFKPQ